MNSNKYYFKNIPIEIENYIFRLVLEMNFANVYKDLQEVKRSIYRVSEASPISRGIITWELPNKILKTTNKQIYIFNYSTDFMLNI